MPGPKGQKTMRPVARSRAGAKVTEAAGESQTASGRMLDAASGLAEQGNVLRKAIDTFLTSVRAA